jgi:hypothetical protein
VNVGPGTLLLVKCPRRESNSHRVAPVDFESVFTLVVTLLLTFPVGRAGSTCLPPGPHTGVPTAPADRLLAGLEFAGHHSVDDAGLTEPHHTRRC